MRWIKELGRRVGMLLRREQFDRDLDEEMRLHLELRAEEQAARGASAEDARHAAQRRFGNPLLLRERSQDAWGWTWLEQMVQDVRYGVRNVLRTPGFTAITVLTLALGIGGTTAIFSAVSPILFESLPYPDAKRISVIWEVRPDRPPSYVTFGMYRGLAERNHSFEALAAIRPWQPTLTSGAGADHPERFDGQRVSSGYLRVLGVSPAMGRDFQPSEDRLNGPNVVILSDGLWRRRFAADPSIIGRQIPLEQAQEFTTSSLFTVIGVMPGGFEDLLAPSAELWTPLQYDMSQGRAWGHHLRLVGRRRPGVSVEQAAQELNALGATVLQEQHPQTYGQEVKFSATSLQDDLTSGVRQALLAILGAVTLVLVIACVNVTNLLLARGVHRRGEFALRAALGAGRSRLIRQVLTESLLLATLGGLAGIGVAMLGVRALVALSPPGLPRLAAIGVNGTLFAFGFGITTLIGLAFGLAPAWHAARTDPHEDLQHGSRLTSGGHRRTRSALVVAEVALALVLLVTSGLLLRSLERLFAVPVGFESPGLLTMQVQTAGPRFKDDAVTRRFFAQALDAVKRVPGVRAAAFTSLLPLSGESDIYGATFENSPSDEQDHGVFRYAVSPGYPEIMRIPLRQGRLFDEHDVAGAPPVMLISESLARRKFPKGDAIGQRVDVGAHKKWFTVVGVVGDVKQMSLAVSQADAVYVPAVQWHWADTTMSLAVRTRGDAAALAADIRKAVWSVDKDQPVMAVATMDELVARSAAERRFTLDLFAAFALLALAAAGIYGVLSGSVAERTREMGVRAALGATRGDILGLVLRQGMALTALGVAIGLAGAVNAGKAIAAMLFGISPLDAVTFLGVIALLATVSAAACAVPAWRAARVDPASTLRAE